MDISVKESLNNIWWWNLIFQVVFFSKDSWTFFRPRFEKENDSGLTCHFCFQMGKKNHDIYIPRTQVTLVLMEKGLVLEG